MSSTLTLGTVSIAEDLRLTPQARKILAHLESGRTITPMEAIVVYSVQRLAARIHEIRTAGYPVQRSIKRDMEGHPYGSYQLMLDLH